MLHAALGDASGNVRRAGEPDNGLSYERFTGPLGRLAVELPWPQTIAGAKADWEVLLGRVNHTCVLRAREGRVIVIADPGLAQNGTLHLGEHARLWDSLLRKELGTKNVAFDELFHGHGRQPSLGASHRLPGSRTTSAHANKRRHEARTIRIRIAPFTAKGKRLRPQEIDMTPTNVS